jgi:hypothetical protein
VLQGPSAQQFRRRIFAGALMSDNPNHLLWRERIYEVRMAGVPEG